MAKVLVKIIIDTRADALSNDLKFLRAQPEARAVKLVMPDGSTMADMVRAALVKADFDSQYQCIDVSYRDEDFDEDVYISPSSLIELQTIYKVIVSKLVILLWKLLLLLAMISLFVQIPLFAAQQPSALSNYYPGDRSNFFSLDNYRSRNQLEDKFPQTSSSYVDYLQLSANNSQQHSYASQDDLFRQHELERYSQSHPADMYRDRHDATGSQPYYDYATYDQQPRNNIPPLGSYPRKNARNSSYYSEQNSSTYFFGHSAYTDPTQYYYGNKIKQKREQLNGGEKAKEERSKETVQPPKPLIQASKPNQKIQAQTPNQDVQLPKSNQDIQAPIPNQIVQAPKPNMEVQTPKPNLEVQLMKPKQAIHPAKPSQQVVQLNSESTSVEKTSNGDVEGGEKKSETDKEPSEYEPIEESEQQNQLADLEESKKLQSASEQHKKETAPNSKPLDKKKKRSYNTEAGMHIPSLFESPIVRSSPRMMHPMPGAHMQRPLTLPIFSKDQLFLPILHKDHLLAISVLLAVEVDTHPLIKDYQCFQKTVHR
uniref:PB1 domain-containing protein n=1 Tax=Ditylenchus dipsaci TaxID=166011 RepID=A0A915D231_9BILA